MTALFIKVKGLVQGVGFRPFVYRIALKNNIFGWVSNNNEGVSIHVEGNTSNLDTFLNDLIQKVPVAAEIKQVEQHEAKHLGLKEFSIRKSDSISKAVTEVSPDIAVCDDCLSDMQHQFNRLAYPFTNCTNCGPRFSIIRALPYDRPMTTMNVFEICPDCKKEYTDILDRRFHAQPVACKNCGPIYTLAGTDGNFLPLQKPAETIAKWIDKGQIVALKGMGGYHLICDATNETAVQKLRKRKLREGKPMAVMTSMHNLLHRFNPSDVEKEILQSWRRPIVLMQHQQAFVPSIANGLNTTGIVLPYMPIHHQLFENLATEAIVLTSGNYAEEPVTINDNEAFKILRKVADQIVGYNREIYNRADDSVVMVVAKKPVMIRRSRGFAPSPIATNLNCEGIFAAGAELVNTFAIGKDKQLILSQHIGDLKNAETLSFYEESFSRFSKLFRFNPELIACDKHPDYLSTRFAHQLGVEVIEVQHHHAHIASCMAENGLDEKVIGIALDGTGYGDDQTIWGGEFFICDLAAYERIFHFDPVPLPGGDKVTSEPWRTAVAYLFQYFGKAIFEKPLAFLNQEHQDKVPVLIQAMERGINCPLSSGAGRLFDAVAAITGICTQSSFHAEAPMRLESNIKEGCNGKYLLDIEGKKIVFKKMFYLILKDLNEGVSVQEIAAKFHNTMLWLILTIAKKARKQYQINIVTLSGGSFQNRYLLKNSIRILEQEGFKVFIQQQVPSNDGGIALGQAAVAAKIRSVRLCKP